MSVGSTSYFGACANYVDFMGGADAVLAKARSCFERGEYRWVVQVVNHVVFADPANRHIRITLLSPYSSMEEALARMKRFVERTRES